MHRNAGVAADVSEGAAAEELIVMPACKASAGSARTSRSVSSTVEHALVPRRVPAWLLLLDPVPALLQEREQSLRADEMRGADNDEAGSRAFQTGIELRHPVAVPLGDQ